MPDIGTWWEYVTKYTRGQSQREIAATIGIDPTAVGRWKDASTGRPRAEHVVEFARKYTRPPTEALIHAGYLRVDEIGQPVEIIGSMNDVSDAAILDELRGRLAAYRGLLLDHDAQNWPPGEWGIEDPGVRGMQDRDNRQ